MILSIASASVDDPDADYIYSAWSDMVVGERPQGLLECSLSKSDEVLQMVSIWDSIESHDQALSDRESHPALGVFAACGVEPQHSIFHVIGQLGQV